MLAFIKILSTHVSLKHFIWPRDHADFKKKHAVCVYRQMCVHIQRDIYIHTNIYALTQCNKHRHTQTPTISRQSSSLCFPLVPTVPRIFSSNYISFHVINLISRQQATSACKAKKDYMFQCKCKMMVQLSRCSYKEGNKYD